MVLVSIVAIPMSFSRGQVDTSIALQTPKMVSHVTKPASKQAELEAALKAVCSCESSYEGTRYGKPRQFNPDGSIRRGRQNSHDVGACQINEDYHLAASQKLGMDIYTEEGNIEYANYLYKHQGTKPWSWSKNCWGQ